MIILLDNINAYCWVNPGPSCFPIALSHLDLDHATTPLVSHSLKKGWVGELIS